MRSMQPMKREGQGKAQDSEIYDFFSNKASLK